MRIGQITAVFCLVAAAGLPGRGQTASQTDWPMYGHDDSSNRYSPLTQINTGNVSGMTRAWTYHMASGAPPAPAAPSAVQNNAAAAKAGAESALSGSRGRGLIYSEATPIMVGNVLYMSTPYHSVIALDPESGKLVWSYSMGAVQASERGVSYWPGDGNAPAAIIFGSTDGRLWSLNAATGKPNPNFGENGSINLLDGIANGVARPRLDITSPPPIYKNLVITGGRTQESPSRGPSADTRAWDLRTGKLVWRFHSVPHPGELGNNTWPANGWQSRGGTNVWGFMSLDEKRGIVYMPYGSPTYDFYGADREGDGLFGNSLVALNVETGKLVWYFQVVHHDMWDYDLESAPVLMDVRHDGKIIPAVALISKDGMLYFFDRRNGKPIYGVEERPVPASPIPGEHISPTQPFPVKPGPIGPHSFSPNDVADVTPEQKAFCTNLLATEGGMASGGPFTPYGPKLTITMPGSLGTVNWAGMSYNPKLGYLFFNASYIGDVGKVAPNTVSNDPAYRRTSPWGTYGRFWNGEKYWPCQKPPWGELWAINVNTGEIAWKVPFGQIKELEAKGVYGTGTLSFGGSITTAGGLIFIAASDDEIFRAFDAATGKVLWSTKLETGAYVTPITYRAANGKQYVVLTVTGGSYYDRTNRDMIEAFALP